MATATPAVMIAPAPTETEKHWRPDVDRRGRHIRGSVVAIVVGVSRGGRIDCAPPKSRHDTERKDKAFRRAGRNFPHVASTPDSSSGSEVLSNVTTAFPCCRKAIDGFEVGRLAIRVFLVRVVCGILFMAFDRLVFKDAVYRGLGSGPARRASSGFSSARRASVELTAPRTLREAPFRQRPTTSPALPS